MSYDLGFPDSNSGRYAYSDSNWVRFDDGNTLYGLWGTNDSNGDMNSLGFVRKDTSCYGPFSAALGGNINWNTPIPGTELVEPTLPSDAQTWLDNKFNELPLLTPTALTVPVPGVPEFPDLPLDGPPSGPQPGTIQPTDPASEEAEPAEAPAEESPAENAPEDSAEGGDDEWVNMKVAGHDHDETAESGLIAAAIAIWALVAILFVAFLIMYCSEKKSRAANYTVQ